MKPGLSATITIAFFILFCHPFASVAQLQSPRFAIYISNPVGLFSKVRFKAECKFDMHNAIQVSYADYWGFYPGEMAGLEYRRYSYRYRHREVFMYGKAGWGNFRFANGLFLDDNSYDMGVTYYAGAGMGRHFNFRHFFLDLAWGLKAAIPPMNTPAGKVFKGVFYSTGPGSIIDINLHFGLQFWIRDPTPAPHPESEIKEHVD